MHSHASSTNNHSGVRSIGARPQSAGSRRSSGIVSSRSVPDSTLNKSRIERIRPNSAGLNQIFQDASSVAANTLQAFGVKDIALPELPLPQLPLPGIVSEWFKQPREECSLGRPLPEARGKQNKQLSQDDKDAASAKLLQKQADTNEAVQLLRRRAREGSLPGQRRDAFKLGLVVEGGGMRGAVSGGALQALHDLGYRDCIDAVYGSSAGAINATYFLSGQREGVDIYAQDITNTDFIDLKRLLPRNDDPRPALNLNYLLDYVMNEVKPLDWQAVVKSPIPLKIVASCLDTLQPVLLSTFKDAHDLRECLRASAMVPEVAGQPVFHRGRQLVDAAVFEAIPFRAAIADGCTHIIALPTRPPYRKGDLLGKLIDDSVATIVKRAVLSPAYMRQAWIREMEYQKAFGMTPEELLVQGLSPGAHKLAGMAGCHVFPVFPGAAASYSPLCIDAATIMLGVAEGRSAALKTLGPAGPLAVPPPAPKPVREGIAAPKPAPLVAATRGQSFQ